MNKNGFTLIEILIALMVFAIIAGITSSAMYYAFNTRSKINTYADRLSELQIAVNLLEQDTDQIINRPVRGDDMRTFPAFIGAPETIEFTRAGVVNPRQLANRSTLKRIAFLCQNHQLIRRSWLQTDSPNRKRYEDRIVIDQLKACKFSFMDNNKQQYKEWLSESITNDQKKQVFPSIIQLDIELIDWGKLSLTLLVPEAIYANLS